MKTGLIQKLNDGVATLSLEESFSFLLEQKLGTLSFSTSFGQEDQVLTHSIFKNNYPITVFTLDTGRLFEETYEVYQRTIAKYNKTITPYFPNAEQVENLLLKKGPFSFHESIENRKECCSIRKIEPLKRVLKNVSVWITGLRAEQSASRESLNFFTYDKSFDLIKFNPLLKWSLQEVEQYLKEYNVPQNSLHKKDFTSIGCAPCTRAVEKGEDIRSGRWWWENSKKECGLHG